MCKQPYLVHLYSLDETWRIWVANLNSTDNNNTSSSDNVTTSKPNLVTDLTSNLNAQEIILLSKGPKFSLSPGISEHTITGINIAFYRLANQIRWKHFRESRFQPSDFLTYPQSRHIYKPESEDELERKLQRIHHKLQTTLKELQPQRKWSNISHAEKKVIKELKEKNYICLPSDKGTEFCVIQQDTYTRVALAHLNDSSTYQKVPRMSAKTVENKVNSTWKKVCLRNEIPSLVRKSFIAGNTDLPRFYHLIKTHKTGPAIKIPPIVSNTNGPTQRLSWLLANALKPLLKDVSAHLENSLELIKYIQAGDFTTNKTLPYPCSLDVVSLYTSIPIQEAITNATDRIHNPIFHLAKQDIKDLLTVTLNNMYFSFNDQVFRQKEGLPMGSNISAILAIMFMDRLETIALSSHLSISPYKRYVDDIYLQTTCEDMADQFHSTMNNLHPKLKFEIEKPVITPSGHSLSLLDFKVTISKDGKSSFEFYKKTAKKPIFVHHQSAIPTKSKINFIRNERKRIEDKCSTKMIARKHQNTFDDVLRLNGYPESIIDKTKHSQNHQENPRPSNTEWSHMKIPYISERLNYRITSIFRKEDIPVRVAHKSYTLRRALSHNNKERTCTRANCPISGTKLCLLRNAVYQITCNNCNQHYIGSTIRFIHDRVREHLNNDNSSVKKHLSQCQNKGIEIKSIVLENDPANLRLLEAF